MTRVTCGAVLSAKTKINWQGQHSRFSYNKVFATFYHTHTCIVKQRNFVAKLVTNWRAWNKKLHSPKPIRTVCLCVCMCACPSVSWSRAWAVLKRLDRSKCRLWCGLAGLCEPLLGGSPDPQRELTLLGIIIGRAQTCPLSIFTTLFARSSSDAAFGYQSTVAMC